MNKETEQLFKDAREEVILKTYRRHRRIQIIAGISFVPFILTSVYVTWLQFGYVFALILVLVGVNIYWQGVKTYKLPPQEYIALVRNSTSRIRIIVATIIMILAIYIIPRLLFV